MIYAFEFSVLIALILLTSVVLRRFPDLAERVLGPAPSRMAELDGLRGVLSILVVLHHCVIFRLFAASGTYDSPVGNVENLAGDASVALFFVITAYLLWGRMLRTGGEIDWRQFYLGRLRRLTPMYMLAVAGLVAIVVEETGFQLRVPAMDFCVQVLRWMGFALLPQSDINGRADTHAILVVLWTLKYEWIFYLIMPILAVFARGKSAWALYGLSLLTALSLGDAPLYGYFVAGAVAAHLAHRSDAFRLPPYAWMALSLAALYGLAAKYHDIYGLPQIVLIFVLFQGVLTGAGPWAVLRLQSLRFLGNISYSTYLVHHMILHLMVFRLLGADTVAAFSDGQFAIMSFLGGAISIGLSVLTYVTVEQPWMQAKPVAAPIAAST